MPLLIYDVRMARDSRRRMAWRRRGGSATNGRDGIDEDTSRDGESYEVVAADEDEVEEEDDEEDDVDDVK